MTKLLSIVLFTSSIIAGNVALAKDVVLGNLGTQRIALTAPDDWSSSSPAGQLPEVVTLRLAHGSAPDDVLVLVSVISPPAGSPLENANADAIAQLVAASAEQASSQSVEQQLDVEPLTDGSVRGAYFSATDKAPPPGEYKYLTQGMARMGKLAVTFTALSNSDPAGAKKSMLAIVGSLRATVP